MGAVGLLSRGVKLARPIVSALHTADSRSREGGELVVLPGDPGATERLRELLGTPPPTLTPDALAVFPAVPGAELDTGAAALAHRRRSGAGALAVLIGPRDERAALERELLAGHRLEPSNIAHVASLEGRGAEMVVDAVVAALGDEAVAAGRRNPGLRPVVGRRLVRRTARQAAGIGALPLSGADMPVLALLQVRMVAQLAALHDRPFGAERALEALAILGGGLGWRALGRSVAGMVPFAGWAARGAFAYAVTRAHGELALARLAAGHDLIEGPPLEVLRPHIERVLGGMGRLPA